MITERQQSQCIQHVPTGYLGPCPQYLEIAMEYAGAVGVIVLDKASRLHDLTEAQVGRNQFVMDIVVNRLDEKDEELEGRMDKASKQMAILEG